MNTKIESLEKTVMNLIKAQHDINGATSLLAVATKLRDIRQRADAIDRDLKEVENAVANFTHRPQSPQPLEAKPESTSSSFLYVGRERSRQSVMKVTLNWATLGKPLPREEIRERKASDTLAVVLERLAEVLGKETIERLTRYQVSRGPLISDSPERDFRNQSNGTLYQHQEVRGTPFNVLTHSATHEKVEYLNQLPRVLGLPAGFLTAASVAKDAY